MYVVIVDLNIERSFVFIEIVLIFKEVIVHVGLMNKFFPVFL